MAHRAHLFSLRLGNALRESLSEGYSRKNLAQDVVAGITVGIIAIPLAMALAIASGVPPQYGLYTAIIAGFIIALAGGSRFSISGPTAAFVVILFPVAQQHGLSGLLVATMLSGGLLVLMALLRLGRLIEYIPEAVTLGFTAGIAVVIATLQLRDTLGLTMPEMPAHFVEKVMALGSALHTLHWPSLTVAAATLITLVLWPRLKTPLPAHLPALLVGTGAAAWLALEGHPVDTIGSRFTYLLPDGSTGHGIPSALPSFEWPWLRPNEDGSTLTVSWQLLRDLLPAAFAMAMLGAIESLLCAVVLDGMTGKRHSANSELMGQGLGNIVAPFFGGITATAAIARSAANVKAGAYSPFAAMIHAAVVLLGLVALTGMLALLPMPAMAALLIMVAWNMSEAPKALHLVRTAPRGDLIVFFTCFSLTVLFDMVIAIAAGVVLAALLFMKEIAEMTRVSDISDNRKLLAPCDVLPDGWRVMKINGPLFFAAADRIFGEISLSTGKLKGMILQLEGVPLLDAGGLAALEKLVAQCRKAGTHLMISDVQFQPLKTLARAKIKPEPGTLTFFPSLREALAELCPDTATRSEQPV